MKKRLSLLMALMMVLSLVPMSAFAAGTPFTSVATIDNQTTGNFNVTFELPQYAGLTSGKIRLELENADFTTDNVVARLSTTGNTTTASVVGGVVFIDVLDAEAPISSTKITLNLQGKVDYSDSAKGDVFLVVTDSSDTGIGSQKVKIAVVTEESSKDLSISVKEADKKLSVDGGKLSQFEIKNFGTIATTKAVEIKLPANFSFTTATAVYVDGAIVTSPMNGITFSGRTITMHVPTGTKSVLVMPEVASVSNKASFGDIEVSVKVGTDTETAVIGQLVDYSVTIKAVESGKKVIPTFYGGLDGEQTVKVTLSGVKGSFGTRPIDFKLTDVKVNATNNTQLETKITSITGGTLDVNSSAYTSSILKDGEFTIVPTAMTDKIEFTIKFVADWNKDATATLTAKSREFEVETDIAVIVPMFTVSTDQIEVKKGESTKTSDIVITEAEAGLIENDITIRIDGKRGVEFADDGTAVKTTNGLKLKKSDIGTDATSLVYGYDKTKSSKEGSVITLSELYLAIAGSTVDSTVVLDVLYDGEKVASIDYATVVKEYANEPSTTVFTIDNMKYTVNGVEETLLAAPYIKEGRTMLPVRALAEALGLTVDYNAGQAIFSSPTKTASHVIGTDMMYVNGTPVKLNVASELKSDTTFVELRSLAAAFGVEIAYNATTKAVTVQG